ncbi:MAG: hypothetical protein FJY97_05670 [candidate division Zixibacteria bacterium]|nr:hypothetical protein [candidate division Zixibacteria bacterium]
MNPDRPFQLFLFSVEPTLVKTATAAGVDGFIVDWEQNGKENRQTGYDTQINANTLDDLKRVRSCTDALVICRLNAYGLATKSEIEKAVAAGADEVLLPMVRTVEEVECVIGQVRERCRVGILIETMSAVSLASSISHSRYPEYT